MTQPNPFQTPGAELTDATAPSGRLYTVGGACWATFIGTPMAGVFIMTRNLHVLGRSDEAAKVWGWGVLLTVALLTLGFVLPENVPSAGFAVAQVVIMQAWAKHLFAQQLLVHRERGGAFFSNWRAVGLAIPFLIGAFVLLFGVVLLLDPWLE